MNYIDSNKYVNNSRHNSRHKSLNYKSKINTIKNLSEIDYNTINNILYRFPKIIVKNNNIFNNLNTDNKLLHNADSKYFICKPKGKRSYLWFTYLDNKLICILILINNNKINDNTNQFYNFNIN